jgi:hypothetical protein
VLQQVYADGSTALPDWELEASIREFYGTSSERPFGGFLSISLPFGSDRTESGCAAVIFPSLLQLPSGITELDEKKQARLCLNKFRKAQELERGICLDVNRKVVLPDCAHAHSA